MAGNAFAYDAAGNLIEKGNKYTISGNTVTFSTSGTGVEYWEYTYDLLNQLIKVTKNGTNASEYQYDPEGLRVVKKVNGQTTHYVFEGTEPIFEKNITTNKVKSYIYAFGKHLARVDGKIGDTSAKKYFYHTDHLGSIKAVTDQTGSVVYKTDYHAFGTQFGTEGNFDEVHGFNGKEYEAATGLYYYNARWYDSETGRFISEDPAADPNNPNLYSYCGNNPVNRIDPTGMDQYGPSDPEDDPYNGRDGDTGSYEDSGSYEQNQELSDAFSSGDSSSIEEAFETLINNYGTQGAVDWIEEHLGSAEGEKAFERAYEVYWSSRTSKYLSTPETLKTSISFLWIGIEILGEKAMPEKGWGITSHKDNASMNQVRAIQAALEVEVTGQFDDDTQHALDIFIFVETAQQELEKGFKEKNGNNITPYGEWYGLNGQPWCAMFVSWCADRAGILGSSVPKYSSVLSGKIWYMDRGNYKSRTSGYTPKAGDVIFFSKDGERHTGIVTAYDPNSHKVYTIEGNSGDSVAARSYSEDSTYIDGYGVMVVQVMGRYLVVLQMGWGLIHANARK